MSDAYIRRMVSCLLTLDESGEENTAIEARSVADVDYGHTCVDAIARIRVFFVGVFEVDPTAFGPRFRDILDVDFAGEP